MIFSVLIGITQYVYLGSKIVAQLDIITVIDN